MRLINVQTFKFEEFHDCTQVKYAILSHRWGPDEVLYKDMAQANGRMGQIRSMKGFHKIEKSCKEAATRGYQYAWVDTCCIDKSSSAELQEAINSMFRWYACAEICFAFLSDVPWSTDASTFDKSEWFERGWTLQELLAPRHLVFFDSDWQRIDSRRAISARISTITGIPERLLHGSFNPNWKSKSRPCVAAIMSWASNRKTTRLEDRAYSLLGLFDVNMPLLYGEGEKAFYRLQTEILQQNEDQSIFAWDDCSQSSVGLLAASPDNFRWTNATALLSYSHEFTRCMSSQVSSEGIHLEVKLVPVTSQIFMALLNLTFVEFPEEIWLGPLDNDILRCSSRGFIGVYVLKLGKNRYARVPSPYPDSTTDLAHWPEAITHNLALDTRITVVRRLHDNESQLTRDPSWTRNSLHEIQLAVLSGHKDFWTKYLKDKAITPVGFYGREGFAMVHDYMFDEENLLIQLKGTTSLGLVYKHGSVPFGSLVFGLDFNSELLCFFSMFSDFQILYQEALCLPYEWYAGAGASHKGAIIVQTCVGGRFHILKSKAAVVFRMSKRREMAGAHKLKIQMELFPLGTKVQLGIVEQRRYEGAEIGWRVYIDVENSPTFLSDIEYSSRSFSAYRPDTDMIDDVM